MHTSILTRGHGHAFGVSDFLKEPLPVLGRLTTLSIDHRLVLNLGAWRGDDRLHAAGEGGVGGLSGLHDAFLLILFIHTVFVAYGEIKHSGWWPLVACKLFRQIQVSCSARDRLPKIIGQSMTCGYTSPNMTGCCGGQYDEHHAIQYPRLILKLLSVK